MINALLDFDNWIAIDTRESLDSLLDKEKVLTGVNSVVWNNSPIITL